MTNEFPTLLKMKPGECVIRVGMTIREAERILIEATMAIYPDKGRAAGILGISLKTLYTRLREYEIARKYEASK